MNNYVFEVHKYAPELNKVYYKGVQINVVGSILLKLGQNYTYNLRIIREYLKPKLLKRYKLVAERPDGSIETRFCNTKTTLEALKQFKKAKEYYNIEGTKLTFKVLNK